MNRKSGDRGKIENRLRQISATGLLLASRSRRNALWVSEIRDAFVALRSSRLGNRAKSYT